ncbi:MAG: MBOAT family protein [Clostridia bacterium]|nr:MBOAT family protein [Clostridia bacterium]
MIFSSLEFLFVFLPVTILLYYLLPRPLKNTVLLVMSLIFYGVGEPIYILLMIFTIFVDYICGYLVGIWKETRPGRAKAALIAAIVLNLLLLGFFKYYDFIAVNLSALPFISIKPLSLTLPIGISFYTFQIMSYVIDVYRGAARMQKNPFLVATYVTLFPQLIAGPIVRYQDVDDQLSDRKESVALFASGLRTFTSGLAKKVLLANTAASLCEAAAASDSLSVFGAWVGIVYYCFQIYFDFSGYSDMAIGLGKMFGFRFLENFNYPYISQSVTEFWRRWHISLSTWFREYVYIPLGGNRVDKKWKLYRNLFIVWFLTGMWHGANWNFILWGLYYFLLLVVEKAFLLRFLEKVPSFFRHVYALVFILFGWLIFYFTDSSQGFTYLQTMFGIGSSGICSATDLYDLLRNVPFLVVSVVACLPAPKALFYRLYEKKRYFPYLAAAGTAVLFLLSVSYLVDGAYNPFLYTRF